MNDTTTTASFVGSIASLVGFWAALALIAGIAFIVIRSSFRRDHDGLIPENGISGILMVIAAPLLAAVMIGTTSGTLWPDLAGTGQPSSRIPELAERISRSDFMIYAITAVVIIWVYAFCSSLIAILLRRRQRGVIYNSPPTPA